MSIIVWLLIATTSFASESECKKLWEQSLLKPVSSVLSKECEDQRLSFEIEKLKSEVLRDREKGSKEKMWAIESTVYVHRKEVAETLLKSEDFKEVIEYIYPSEQNFIVQYRPIVEVVEQPKEFSSGYLFLYAVCLIIFLITLFSLINKVKKRK